MVTSSKAVKVEPVKEAFQKVFGRATVFGRVSLAPIVHVIDAAVAVNNAC